MNDEQQQQQQQQAVIQQSEANGSARSTETNDD